MKIINDFEGEENGGEKEFDLMTLRFDKELLGQETLEAGFYNQIRLIVAADEKDNDPTTAGKSKVVYEKETNKDDENIFIPSGAQSGLKIDYNFEIREDAITELTLDLDVSKVMHEAGKSDKIILKPTAFNVIDEIITGSILGRVVDSAGNAVTEKDVIVEAYTSEADMTTDEPVNSTFAAAAATDDKKAGSFLIRGLDAGDYKLKAYTLEEVDEEMVEGDLSGTLGGVSVEEETVTELDENIILE